MELIEYKSWASPPQVVVSLSAKEVLNLVQGNQDDPYADFLNLIANEENEDFYFFNEEYIKDKLKLNYSGGC